MTTRNKKPAIPLQTLSLRYVASYLQQNRTRNGTRN